jgi:hypothetical protein
MGTLTLSTAPAPSTVNDRLEELAHAALVADIDFKEAKAKAESTKAAFRKALEEANQLTPDFKGIGAVRTVIKEVRKFDPAKAVQLLTPEEIQQCSALSGALVKANVAPTVYELMQSQGTTSLELKVAD